MTLTDNEGYVILAAMAAGLLVGYATRRALLAFQALIQRPREIRDRGRRLLDQQEVRLAPAEASVGRPNRHSLDSLDALVSRAAVIGHAPGQLGSSKDTTEGVTEARSGQCWTSITRRAGSVR